MGTTTPSQLAIPSTGTLTITLENPSTQPPPAATAPETVVLRLRRPQKKVSWKEGTVDNEFLGRKSSKKCCIFHKEKPFDEDYSDDDECGGNGRPPGDDGAGPSNCCSSHGH